MIWPYLSRAKEKGEGIERGEGGVQAGRESWPETSSEGLFRCSKVSRYLR